MVKILDYMSIIDLRDKNTTRDEEQDRLERNKRIRDVTFPLALIFIVIGVYIALFWGPTNYTYSFCFIVLSVLTFLLWGYYEKLIDFFRIIFY